ncbi:MAG: DHH family phosphoesterase [Candidatus Falkowbacteria bacterium]|nr:DHH family phosphoesterase [Candidatus Falkowbacteria bacterium]
MLDLEQQIFRQLEKSKNVLIVFPADRDNDAIASALALFLFLKKIGVETEITGFKNDDRSEPLFFLPSYQEIKKQLDNLRRFIVSLDISQAKVNQIKYSVDADQLNFIISPKTGWFKPEDVSTRTGEFRYDLIFTVGVSDLEALGKLYDDNVEFFYKTTIINIDHQAANEEFGQINFVDLNAITTAEIVFYLLKNYKPEMISEDIATCLLAGIIQRTKNFKTANLTPRVLLTTSELITLGARREEIITHLYRSRDMSSLKLWGKILNNLQAEKKNELLWSKLDNNDFKETGATMDSLSDIIDELIATVPSAKIILIFCEETPDKTTLLAYSLKNINVLDFIREYGALGGIKTAQATLNMGIKAAISQIIPKLQNKLEKLSL